MQKGNKPKRTAVAATLVSLSLMVGMTAQMQAWPPRDQDLAYHQRVKTAVEAIPFAVGDWVGRPIQMPEASVSLLKPNAMVSREYQNVRNGQRIQYLLVHCSEVRDINGHYPPTCYPAAGWEMRAQSYVAWQVGNQKWSGVEYEFDLSSAARSAHLVVANTMILPNGRVVPDMTYVRRAAEHYLHRSMGAAQVQLVFPADLKPQTRKEIAEQFLAASRPAIETIRAGGTR